MHLRPALAAALATVLAATAAGAQMVTIPFGGPKRVKPSAALTLRGSPADIAGAVATKARPVAMTDRDAAERPVEVLGFLGLSLGARVLVVAATGAADDADARYYAEIVGTAVGPGGSVAALVPPAAMADPVRRAALSGVVGRAPNVAIVVGALATVRLPADRDFVLIALGDGTGDGDAAAISARLYAAVRPGGIVGVIGTAAGTRPSADACEADLVRAGFVLDGRSDLRLAADPDGGRVVVRFRKPE